MSKIYLSPSTQENNIGAGDYGTEELRMNQLCDIIEPMLKARGYEAYRNKPTMALKEVVTDSNLKKPDIHVAIHSNANNKTSRGCEIYCHRFGGAGEKLARAIYKYLEPITPTPDRGVKQGADFFGVGKHLYETAYTHAPAVIIEVAFHDNPDDAKWIVENMRGLAIAIAAGIDEYFGIDETERLRRTVSQLSERINALESELTQLKKDMRIINETSGKW